VRERERERERERLPPLKQFREDASMREGTERRTMASRVGGCRSSKYQYNCQAPGHFRECEPPPPPPFLIPVVVLVLHPRRRSHANVPDAGGSDAPSSPVTIFPRFGATFSHAY
jgi:hypothetical protein